MFHLLRQRTQHTSTLWVPAQLSHRARLLRVGVIKVRPSAQHLTSRYHHLMWDMKKHHPLAHVKNLDDHYSSVISAPNVNFLRKGRSFCATNEKHQPGFECSHPDCDHVWTKSRKCEYRKHLRKNHGLQDDKIEEILAQPPSS